MSILLYFGLCLCAADNAPVWPGFLGAGASPITPQSVPLKWTPTEHVAWTAPLPGHGQSSPVIWGDQVFVTSVDGPMKDNYFVVALSLKTGEQLWSHTLESTDKVKNSLYVSRAAPTPVVDGKQVYAYFESGDLVALTHAGKPVWKRSLSTDYGKFKNKFGLSASPVQTDDAVIVLIDDEGPSYLVALSKTDGRPLWKTDRTSRVSWSSPAIVTVAGKPQVVCSSAGSVDGYDPATGKLLWSYTDIGGNTAATPLPFAEGQFLIGASPGRDNADRAENARKSNLAMSIELVDGQPTPKVLWRTEQAVPSFGSPVVYRGLAYWVNRTGVVYCFDAKTGEKKFTQRTRQSCWATPLGIGDRLYFFGKGGITTVLAAGPEFKVLAENDLWDPKAAAPDPKAGEGEETEDRRRAAAGFSGPVQYGVAAVSGSLLIRTGDKLYCLRE